MVACVIQSGYFLPVGWCLVSLYHNLIRAFDLIHFLFRRALTPPASNAGSDSCVLHVGGLITSLRSALSAEQLIHPNCMRHPANGSGLYEWTGVLQKITSSQSFSFFLSQRSGKKFCNQTLVFLSIMTTTTPTITKAFFHPNAPRFKSQFGFVCTCGRVRKTEQDKSQLPTQKAILLLVHLYHIIQRDKRMWIDIHWHLCCSII